MGRREETDDSNSPAPPAASSKSVKAGCCVVQRLMGALVRAGHALSEIQEGFQEELA